MTTARDTPQTNMNEIVVEDDDMEKFLKDLVDTRDAASAANKDHEANKERLRGMAEKEGWKEGQTIRCGRFTVAISYQEPVEVPTFERQGYNRYNVKENL